MEDEHLSVVLWQKYPTSNDHFEQTLKRHEEEEVLIHPEECLEQRPDH